MEDFLYKHYHEWYSGYLSKLDHKARVLKKEEAYELEEYLSGSLEFENNQQLNDEWIEDYE